MPTAKSGQAACANVIAATLAALLSAVAAHPAFADESHSFQIPAADASTAVREFAHQSGVQIMASADALKDKTLNPVAGEHTTEGALNILLAASGLRHEYIGDRGVVITPATPTEQVREDARPGSLWSRLRLAQADTQSPSPRDGRGERPEQVTADQKVPQPSQGRAEREDLSVGVPEILVYGSRSLNTDIQRTRDDPLPFVTFDRQQLEASGATNVESFFRARLPMDTNSLQSNAVDPTRAGDNGGSQFNFRGLGPEETLVLVDGKRLVSYAVFGASRQPDLNGIPMSAIERIEILPASASAIYGSGATGGVINIVTRRDYQGVEASVGYESPLDTSAPIRTLGLSGGLGFNEGRTRVVFHLGSTRSDVLYEEDRGYFKALQNLILDRDPGRILNASNAPAGATTNIRSVDGSPLFGSGTSYFTSVPPGYEGGEGLTPFLARQGVYNLDFPNFGSITNDRRLPYGSVTERSAASLGLTQELGRGWEGYVDYSYSENESNVPGRTITPSNITVPASNPLNPFDQNVRISINPPRDPLVGESESAIIVQRAGVGVNKRLDNRWALHLSGSWDTSRQENRSYIADAPRLLSIINEGRFDPFRDYALDEFPHEVYRESVAETRRLPTRTTLRQGIVRAAGPVLALPAGDVLLTIGSDFREEELEDFVQTTTFFDGTPRGVSPARIAGNDSSVWAGYAELTVPIFGRNNRRPGLDVLDAQLALRYEDFSTFGAASSPQVGLRYAPVRGLMFRGSWGTGFLPPTASQLAAAPLPAGQSQGTDPKRGGQAVILGPTMHLIGGYPDLDAEESKSLGFGVILEPAALPGLRLSVDYYDIEKTDEIRTLTVINTINLEDQLPGRVQRGPVAPGDPFGVGPITFVDARATNFSRLESRGFDVTLEKVWEDIWGGTFSVSGTVTLAQSYKVQLSTTQPLTEHLGDPNTAIGAPLKRRGNAAVQWQGPQWGVGWFTQYVDSYAVLPTDVVLLGPRISSVLTHDLSVNWRFDHADAARAAIGRWLSGVSLSGGIKNVLDEEAPLSSRIFTPWSPYSDANLRGRTAYLTLRKAF